MSETLRKRLRNFGEIFRWRASSDFFYRRYLNFSIRGGLEILSYDWLRKSRQVSWKAAKRPGYPSTILDVTFFRYRRDLMNSLNLCTVGHFLLVVSIRREWD